MKYPDIDPVALSIDAFELFGFTIGPISVHWYGIMYLCAFMSAWGLGVYRAGRPGACLNRKQVEDLIFYAAVGVVAGGRVGYVLFYNFEQFLEDPIWLFKLWEGGMAFHGGLLGVVVAMLLFAKKVNTNFFDIMDFAAPLVPLGLGFGRIGNFIGGELWGRETTVSWGMVFPKDDLGLVRHPSQLYQAFLEGVVLFAILFWFSSRPRPRATVSSLFLIVYGCQRFAVEFVRQPDAHIDYYMGWVTRGQILSIPMIVVGVVVFAWAYRNKPAR